jgi:hypothetical protein
VLPEPPFDPVPPGELDAEPVFVPVDGPPSDGDPHAANVEMRAERARLDRICMEAFARGERTARLPGVPGCRCRSLRFRLKQKRRRHPPDEAGTEGSDRTTHG